MVEYYYFIPYLLLAFIPLRTTMRNIRGINTTGSKKCLEMLKKVHIVQENNGGRGVVFTTGTPLCNSISDTYAMQCYLQHDSLKEKGLDRFDNWVKTFARPEEVCEIDVDSSGFRIVHRFAKFFNLPELSKMFGQISIFHNVSQDGLAEALLGDHRTERTGSVCISLYANNITNIIILVNKGFVKLFVISETVLLP